MTKRCKDDTIFYISCRLQAARKVRVYGMEKHNNSGKGKKRLKVKGMNLWFSRSDDDLGVTYLTGDKAKATEVDEGSPKFGALERIVRAVSLFE